MRSEFLADTKMSMRREVEEILGVESGPAGDAQFERGVERLRAVMEENARLSKTVDAILTWADERNLEGMAYQLTGLRAALAGRKE